MEMDINHIRLSQIAGIISFLITGGINCHEPGWLCKKCAKILTASVICHFAQHSVHSFVCIKYSGLPWKGPSAFNIICGKFHCRKKNISHQFNSALQPVSQGCLPRGFKLVVLPDNTVMPASRFKDTTDIFKAHVPNYKPFLTQKLS